MNKKSVEAVLWNIKLEIRQCVAVGLYHSSRKEALAEIEGCLSEQENRAIGNFVARFLKRSKELLRERLGDDIPVDKAVIEMRDHTLFCNVLGDFVLVLLLKRPVEYPGRVLEVVNRWSLMLRPSLTATPTRLLSLRRRQEHQFPESINEQSSISGV